MTYQEWLSMNIKYENRMLNQISKKYGKTSKQYKIKLEQINNLKENIKP